MPQVSEDFQLYLALVSIATLSVLIFLAVSLSIRSLRRSYLELRSQASCDPRFSGREALSLEQFFDEFYAARNFPRLIVAEVLTRYATAARLPAGFLRPEDSFQSLQVSGAGVESFVVDCASALRDAEQRLGASIFEGTLVTLDDYIRASVLTARLSANRGA